MICSFFVLIDKFHTQMTSTNISPTPLWHVCAASHPWAIFRNRERHTFSQFADTFMSGGSGLRSLGEKSWKQTQYCKNHLISQGVPSYVLNDSIFQDFYSQRDDNFNSHIHATHHPAFTTHQNISERNISSHSITICRHGCRTLMLHCGGPFMDEIIVRNQNQCTSYSCEDNDSFTLPLGCATPIVQISVAGCPATMDYSTILARNSNEIFLLRTVSVNDFSSKFITRSSGRYLQTGDIIIEPIQKWQIPHKVLSMCCSQTSWNHASLLTDVGTVYHWTPSQGFVEFSASSIFPPGATKISPSAAVTAGDPGSEMNNFGSLEQQQLKTNIECSLHPQVAFVSLAKQSYILDMRARCEASLQFTTAEEISSYKQHFNAAPYLFVAQKGAVLLMDSRYTKKPVFTQPVADAHSSMEMINGEQLGASAAAGKSLKGPAEASLIAKLFFCFVCFRLQVFWWASQHFLDRSTFTAWMNCLQA